MGWQGRTSKESEQATADTARPVISRYERRRKGLPARWEQTLDRFCVSVQVCRDRVRMDKGNNGQQKRLVIRRGKNSDWAMSG